jgi:hypothetical protein
MKKIKNIKEVIIKEVGKDPIKYRVTGLSSGEKVSNQLKIELENNGYLLISTLQPINHLEYPLSKIGVDGALLTKITNSQKDEYKISNYKLKEEKDKDRLEMLCMEKLTGKKISLIEIIAIK